MHIALIIAHPNDADIYFRGSIVTWQSTEAIAFVKVLDTNLIHLNFSDGELSYSEKFASRLAAEVVSLKPNLLVAPAPNDYHADHRAVSVGALIAVTLQAPVLWVDPMMGNGFLPIYCVGIIPFQDL